MAPFPTVHSSLSYVKSIVYTKLEFFHDQDGRDLKTTFSIADSADSWVTVSRDLVDYSGSGILFIDYVMTATDKKTLRNFI